MRGLGIFLLFSGISLAADLSDVEYRARVLVRNLDASGVAVDAGPAVSEALAAAIEKGGLAAALRPKYEATVSTDIQPAAANVNPARSAGEDKRGRADVEILLLPRERMEVREVAVPDSEFLVEGSVALLGSTWTIRAAVFDRATRATLASGAASGYEEKGLLQAVRKVAAQLDPAWRGPVLERRCEAIRRAVEVGDLHRAGALKRFTDMRKRWPDALAPAACGLLLATRPPALTTDEVIQWGAPAVDLLPAAGMDGRRFISRLGLEPHALLAAACDAAGKPDDAARVRQKGEEFRKGQ